MKITARYKGSSATYRKGKKYTLRFRLVFGRMLTVRRKSGKGVLLYLSLKEFLESWKVIK